MILNHIDDGEGHVIVLLHGMFGSHTNLNNIARFLSSNYRVLNCDLRNQGDSFHNDTMDLTSMANDVVRLLDKLDIKQASVLGHSLGGKVAMQFALMFPNRCSKLRIADISPVAYAPRHDVVLDSLLNLSNLDIERRSQADNFLKKTIDNEVMRAFLLKNLSRVEGGKYKIKINMKAIKENYYTNLVAAPSGEPYTGPTLFIKGETSAYIQEKHKTLIHDLFPNSSIEVMGKCGHWLHAENPNLFNRLVSDFLN